jgi:hypothetical protein
MKKMQADEVGLDNKRRVKSCNKKNINIIDIFSCIMIFFN